MRVPDGDDGRDAHAAAVLRHGAAQRGRDPALYRGSGLLFHDGLVSGAVLHDHVTGKRGEFHADIVVNATGPWSERIAAMAGVDVPIRPSPGVLLALRGRLCNMVINRLHKSGDGDIVVPQRGLSVVGTSSWVVEDPDDLQVPADHVERMYAEGARLIPAVRAPPRAPPGRRRAR